MESGMAECFGPIAEKNGLVWTEFTKAMKMPGEYRGRMLHLAVRTSPEKPMNRE